MSTFTAEKTLLDSIPNTKYNRYISHDYRGIEKLLLEEDQSPYTVEELAALKEAQVGERLAPRITDYYLQLTKKSQALTRLIVARPEETEDLAGEADPSNQLRYSPVPGLLHKYELVLLYVVRACSAWCRYCYRSDFLMSKTEKDIADVEEIATYIASHNKEASIYNLSVTEAEKKRLPIKEALLSGGDPMVLSNKNLFKYMYGLAKAGIQTIRIGTKELAFFPMRFDGSFFKTLDIFHELFPHTNLAFMVHFSHPDEILEKDEKGEYITSTSGSYKWIPIVEEAVKKLKARPYVTMENQAPIIDGVNDDADALRLLHIELKRAGINNHYYFQCREIEGHRIFAVPVEKAWSIHRDSQKGLSGIEKSRFAMSTEEGKLEVVSVIDPLILKHYTSSIISPLRALLFSLLGEGLIIFKFHRTPNLSRQGDLIIAKRNKDALWLTGYEDRILYDGRKPQGKQFTPLLKELGVLFSEEQLQHFINTIHLTEGEAA